MGVCVTSVVVVVAMTSLRGSCSKYGPRWRSTSTISASTAAANSSTSGVGGSESSAFKRSCLKPRPLNSDSDEAFRFKSILRTTASTADIAPADIAPAEDGIGGASELIVMYQVLTCVSLYQLGCSDD